MGGVSGVGVVVTAPVTPSGRLLSERLVPGSAEWLARMSASKIAAVVGLSPYESRYSLWMRMAGLVPQEQQSDEMARGHYLEPAIAAWFADQHPDSRVEECGTFVHAEHEWMVASPDRLKIDPDGGVELVQCKSAGDLEHWGDEGSDDIPVGYRAQVLWELAVTGLRRCHVPVLLPFLQFRQYVVEFDEAEAAYLITQGRQFLDSIEEGRQPELDGHKATYEAVRQLNPDIADVKVDVPDELGAAYVEAVAAEKAAVEARRHATSLLADHMGSSRQAWFDGRCIARRQCKEGGVPYVVAAKGINPTSVESAA